jgi:hypothetical protein
VRYEYTRVTVEYGMDSVGTIPHYGLLVPSLSFLHKLTTGNVVRLACNRRM